MKKYIFILSLIILTTSGIAAALGAPWPLEPIIPQTEISEPEILLIIGSLFLVIAQYSKKSYK